MVAGFFESLPPFVKALPETKQLDYVLNQLKWMEENCEGEESKQRLRKAAMETVLRYSVEASPFYNDERLLYVFCIVGKLSRTMGIKSVMEELHNRRQFYELAEFYVKWGEIFAEEKNRERFNQIWSEAVKVGAKPQSRVDEAFRSMLYQYFELDDEMTVSLFKKPDASKGLPMPFGLAEVHSVHRKMRDVENSKKTASPSTLTARSSLPSRMRIADQERSIEERFAENGKHAVNPNTKLSVSKLSSISEERSGCASGSSTNPPSNSHENLVKHVQPSAINGKGNLASVTTDVAAPVENDVHMETDALRDRPSECPQSSHLTLHGTSFTEKFLCKAMRDFSSTVPVPPPRSVHHEGEETTVLQETDENVENGFSPSLEKKKFEVYVEREEAETQQEPAKQSTLFTVYSDKIAQPVSHSEEQKENLEQDVIHVRNGNFDIHDALELQSKFKKPTKISSHRRSSIFSRAGSSMQNPIDEVCVAAKEQRNEKIQISLPDCNDEETLAGLNKKTKTGTMTSTPANLFAPPLEDPIEGWFNPPRPSVSDQCLQDPVSDEAVVASTAFGRRISMSEQRRATLTKLSLKIGVENIVGGKITGLGTDSSINDELRRLSIAPKGDDMDERTGEGLNPQIDSAINPWDEKLREKIMTDQRFCSTNLHDFSEKCTRLTSGISVVYGGERFDIENLIGEGGFAKVYKSRSEDGNVYAVKFEIPPCRWEVYICEALRVRMPRTMLIGVMNIRDAYIYLNASAIVYEYHDHGNLLDMVNKLIAKKMSCSGLLTVYLAWEMGRILEAVHSAQIIHGDVKPDNFMILHMLNESATIEQIVNRKSFLLKLIDWGRAIDMVPLKGCIFRGKAGTVAFDCVEMQDGRPWTYQTDFYGFISTIHVIIYGEYMKTFQDNTGRYIMTSVMRRRWQQKDLLQDIFDICMNIPDCESLPKWSTIVDGLENNIKYCVTETRMVWKQAAREFNAGILP